MEMEKIEGYVTDLLEISGIGHEDKEQPLRLTLYHMLMCVKLYEGLDEVTRGVVAKWRKHFQYLIAIKFHLKETKRRKERKAFPSNTPIQEKEKKDKKEKTIPPVCDAKEAFRKECLSYVGQYDTKLLTDFYNYFSEANPRTGKMRWQGKRYWDTKKRLDRWVRNTISTDNTAAAERLKKARGKRQQVSDAEQREHEIAAEREAANRERERRNAESKAGAVTREEWLAMKAAREKTTDCTDYTNDEREEV